MAYKRNIEIFEEAYTKKDDKSVLSYVSRDGKRRYIPGSEDPDVEPGGGGVDEAFVSAEAHDPYDGEFDLIDSNGDVTTIDLNHIHDGLIATGEIDRIKFHVCEDEDEYSEIEEKDTNTLYLIPEDAS